MRKSKDDNMERDWDISDIPPEGDPDVADFAYMLFDQARMERERLGKPGDWMANYSLYRGNQKQQNSAKKGASTQSSPSMLINLYFANVERTVSSITARNPTGEVVNIDGVSKDEEGILSNRLKKWWKDTGQQDKTRHTARMMEIYGIAIEKPFWDKPNMQPDMLIADPFSFYPAPGDWADISTEAPYICYMHTDYISRLERMFDVKGLKKEDYSEALGLAREEIKPQGYGNTNNTLGNYADPMTVSGAARRDDEKAVRRTIVIEVWLRDLRKETITEKVVEMGEDGIPVEMIRKTTKQVYPDGIRKITIAKTDSSQSLWSGYSVLFDCANPNINWNLDINAVANTYPWGRLPCYHANSYRDEVSIWGFSAAEQVGDLLRKINLIMSKLVSYVLNVMAPPLIVQKNCGITKEMIEENITKPGRMVLMPTIPSARIEFMQIPNLPETFFRTLDLIIHFFDRIYQIEEADRGVAPTGVIAASAIIALQERNAIVMQTKTSAIDSLVEQRSRWAIGLWQNHGAEMETINVAGTPQVFMGANYVDRKFSYVVESGSTTPRTSLQRMEMAMRLYEVHAIGQQGLLEALNWENWKEEVERTAESQLDQALQILIAAGMKKEVAIELRKTLMLPQGGPGDAAQSKVMPA
jgi:hypothetical protein